MTCDRNAVGCTYGSRAASGTGYPAAVVAGGVAAGVKPGVSPVNRIAVNVGIIHESFCTIPAGQVGGCG
jgi:hypothetical protein